MMASKVEGQKQLADELWYWYLTGEHKHGFPKSYERMKSLNQKVNSLFPGDTRCFEYNLPLSGSGANLISFTGLRASRFSPQLCSLCESSIRKMEGADLRRANLTARLSSSAGQGEVMISQEAMDHTDGIRAGTERLQLEVKGVSDSVAVHLMRVEPYRYKHRPNNLCLTCYGNITRRISSQQICISKHITIIKHHS